MDRVLRQQLKIAVTLRLGSINNFPLSIHEKDDIYLPE